MFLSCCSPMSSKAGEVELPRGILLDPRRDADAAEHGQSFEPCGEVDPVAKNVAVFDDDVALMDAKAELDPLFGRHARVPLGHRPLYLDRATHCIDDADKLDQEAVAGGLDDVALVLGDLGIDQIAAQRPEARQ